MLTESSDDSAELAARRGGAGDECGAEPSPMMQRLDERGARGIFSRKPTSMNSSANAGSSARLASNIRIVTGTKYLPAPNLMDVDMGLSVCLRTQTQV